MPKKQTDEQVFEPVEDERGRLRLDRRLTPEEAAAQDAEHRELYERNRLERFGVRGAPHKSAT